MFQKQFAMETIHFFFKIKEGYKVSCVKLLMFWYIIRMSERAQIFFGNEGATSGALYKNNFVSDL